MPATISNSIPERSRETEIPIEYSQIKCELCRLGIDVNYVTVGSVSGLVKVYGWTNVDAKQIPFIKRKAEESLHSMGFKECIITLTKQKSDIKAVRRT